MGKSSQAKGRKGEIELARILTSYGYDVRPGEPVSYGVEPDLVGLPGVHIECKRREQVDLSAALTQATRDAEKFCDGVPVVFTRKNRQGWIVCMKLEDWMKLYQGG